MSKKSQSKLKDFRQVVIEEIANVAHELGIEANQVTRGQLVKHSDKVSDWKLKQTAGYSSIRDSAYPMASKNLSAIQDTKRTKGYINKLEKELGNKQLVEEEFRSKIIEKIKPLKVKSYSTRKKAAKKKEQRHVVAMLNDLHIGLKVEPEEVGNLNEFNFEIASRRVAYYINQVCNYKRHRRDDTETLHLLVNGDIIMGNIHGLAGNDLEMMTHQFNGAVHILSYAIANLAEEFKNVKVYNQVGNHGELLHRREHGKRVNAQIYDSVEGQIFYALSAAHSKTKNVEFITNKDMYCDIALPSGRAIMTHGHLLFSKQLGNPGSNINSKGLGVAISDFNSSQRRMNREEAKLVLIGHSHTHMHITTKDNVQVYNAPSLSGVDSYAYSIGITSNLVGQVMFESTKDYIMGDNRLVQVNAADNDKSMDKIIPPYDYELVFKK